MHVTKHRTIDPACLENPRPEGAESGEHRFAIFVSSPNTFFRKVEGYSGLHLHRQVSYPTVTTGKLVENPKEEPEGMRESTRNFREKIHSKDRDPLHLMQLGAAHLLQFRIPRRPCLPAQVCGQQSVRP